MAVNLPNTESTGTCIVDFQASYKTGQKMETDQNEIGECSSNSVLDTTQAKQSNLIETESLEASQVNMHQQQMHRGIKRDVEELHSSSSDHEDMEDTNKIGLKPGKKTRGRVKIKMEYIDNKLRRYTTFSKRKTGIMKKAYELSTLTGTQVMLLVASETGHVYTFATRKLQPMITSESGKALIQTCLNSPDPSVNTVTLDQRMSATGYEEPDLSYSSHDGVNVDKDGKASIFLNQNIDLNQTGTGSMTGITLQSAGNGSFPMTTYLPPSTSQHLNASKSGSGVQSLSVQTVPGGAFATIFTPGATFPNGTYQLGQGTQQPLTQVVNPQVHLQRMAAATTTANTHMDSNCTVTSHNHHHGSPEHPTGDSPPNAGHMSGVPINVLSMQGSEGGQNNAVYTSGNMPLMYNSAGILYATPPTTQSSMGDGDSGGQSHHLIMQDGTVVTNQGIPVSLQHVPGALQVHQEYSNSLQHHSNGIHDNHSSPGDMVGMVDPSSLSVHSDGALEKNMSSHK